MRYVCPSCAEPLKRKAAQYYWRGVMTHGWVCPDCNSLWDIGGAFVRYVEKRTKADEQK